jgi:hypothetical protein
MLLLWFKLCTSAQKYISCGPLYSCQKIKSKPATQLLHAVHASKAFEPSWKHPQLVVQRRWSKEAFGWIRVQGKKNSSTLLYLDIWSNRNNAVQYKQPSAQSKSMAEPFRCCKMPKLRVCMLHHFMCPGSNPTYPMMGCGDLQGSAVPPVFHDLKNKTSLSLPTGAWSNWPRCLLQCVAGSAL